MIAKYNSSVRSPSRKISQNHSINIDHGSSPGDRDAGNKLIQNIQRHKMIMESKKAMQVYSQNYEGTISNNKRNRLQSTMIYNNVGITNE